MAAERRKDAREELEVMTSMTIDHRQVSVTLLNISKCGALVRVGADSDRNISGAVAGGNVSLIMTDGNSSVAKKGNVCRYFEDGANKYVAIDFNRHL
jgi:hypothetical protein